MELLSSNRDLAALSMLSATWRDRDLPSIADNLATVLAPIVNPEFIATTSLGGGCEGYRLAWMRSAVWARSNVIDALRALMPGDMGDSTVSVITNIVNPADQRTCRVLFVPLGIGANALLVIGSADPGFPTASQRILIGLSVCLLSISIQVSRDLTVQKRADAELRSLNRNLERQIISDTNALSGANADLQMAAELQRRADARLQELQAELFHAGRLSAMGQMAGALAHELGQPLGAIANYFSTARRFLTEGREHAADLARTNMDHAAEVVLRAGRIIQHLREFVADGQPERHPENIADLIDDAGLLALIGAATLDIDVARHIAPKLPLALVDRTQIQRVLVNLIRNAIEAMADSERRELILTAARSGGDTIGIAVADSGPGIPDDVASRLFQPFVTTKRQNMGLGLSICRRLSWRMAGNSGTSHAQAVERSSGSQCRRLIEMTMSSERDRSYCRRRYSTFASRLPGCWKRPGTPRQLSHRDRRFLLLHRDCQRAACCSTCRCLAWMGSPSWKRFASRAYACRSSS